MHDTRTTVSIALTHLLLLTYYYSRPTTRWDIISSTPSAKRQNLVITLFLYNLYSPNNGSKKKIQKYTPQIISHTRGRMSVYIQDSSYAILHMTNEQAIQKGKQTRAKK